MPKKKSKKKRERLNYKLMASLGGLFHVAVYLLIDKTFYNHTLFWGSIFVCGLIFGVYFIIKLKLNKNETYHKLEGSKLQLYIASMSLIMILGATLIFGNIINGSILVINYIGKNKLSYTEEYKIEKLVRYKSGGNKKIRRNNPKVYIQKDNSERNFLLPERYNTIIDYSEYRSIDLMLTNGLFGFEIIQDYKLKK
ncbi:hypothetical protein [Winogradskyella sp. PE311]|uniref:hypothetical protein n=1 Tax=Winogradskyella sp. PE311 TaxID=3366943 RepID=UPI00397ED94C